MTGSTHFRAAEFADHDTGDTFVRARLIDHLEQLRTIVGKPLPIVSGYRSPRTNDRVGGARDSQHVYAAAADLPAGLVTLAQALAAGFTGIGTKGKWVTHVDVRDGALRHWTYPE